MDVYTLIAYKKSSVDTCMGCHMASYFSDFEYESFLNKNKLIKKLVQISCLNAQLDTNEVGYQILIYWNGRLCWDDGFTWDYLIDYEDDIRDRVWLEVGAMLDIAKDDFRVLMEKNNKAKAEEERLKQQTAAEALLKKLQEKYGQQN